MGVEKNIPRLYVYRIFQSLMLGIPIFIIFFLENGLSTTQAFLLESIYAISLVALEVPSGAFADKHGRKTSIFLSSVFVFLGSLFFALGHGFFMFLLAEIIFAFAVSLYSGTESAFIYDTLKNLKRTKDFKKVSGNTLFITFFMFGIASLIGSYFANIDLRLAFWVSLIPLGIAMLFPLTFKEPKFSKPVEFRYFSHIKGAISHVNLKKQVKFFIIFSMILYGIESGAWLLQQPFLKFVGMPVIMFGVIYFVIFLSSGLAAKYAYKIEKRFGLKNTIFLMVLLPLMTFFIMGAFPAKIFTIFFIFPSIVYGMQYPIIDDYINKNTSSHNRATVISIKNLSGALLFSVYAPFLGWLTDTWSILAAFLISFFIMLIDMLILFFIFNIKKSKILD